MSLLRGDPDSERSLAQAADRMARAAREAARPGSAWLIGVVYQTLNLGWAFGAGVGWPILRAAIPDVEGVFGDLFEPGGPPVDLLSLFYEGEGGGALLTLLFFPLLFRLVAGLAGLYAADGEGQAQRRPRLRRAWRAGRGLAFPAAGLWIQVVLMMLGAALLFVGPTSVLLELSGLAADDIISVFLTGLCIALIVFYGFVLTILFQIGLHSLVRNRRGVGSALLHSWRIAKQDPAAAARAAAVDFLLLACAFGAFLAYYVVFQIARHVLPGPVGPLLLVPFFVIEGIAGLARCRYWARTYEALGGLSTRAELAGLRAPGV